MGNAAVTAGPAGGLEPGADAQMKKLTSSLKSLSLRGRQLFSKEMEGGQPEDFKNQMREKRKRDEIQTGSLHKELRAGPSSTVTFEIPKNLGQKRYFDDDETSSSGEDDVSNETNLYSAAKGDTTATGMMPGALKKSKGRGAWTPEQDAALKAAVEKYDGKNWKAIAREVPGNRSHIQCLQRWGKVLKPGLVKGPWTEEEDDLLRTYVPIESKGNWVAVAEHVPGRTAKQCRERWSLCLDPNIRKDPWTEEEDDLLLHLHDMHGNAWATIAKHLPGRTENATKSRFKSIERKRDRAWTPMEDATIIRGKSEEKKWSVIASMLPKSNRTKHAVKIRWKELMEIDPALKRFDSSNKKYSSMTSTSSSSFTSSNGGTPGPRPVQDGMDVVNRPIAYIQNIPPPIHGETSPNTNPMFVPSSEAMNENGASFPKNLGQSLSSDKLMNLRIQRNESFEEWLAKEAGGISALPVMNAQLTRSISEELSGPLSFTYEDFADLDLV